MDNLFLSRKYRSLSEPACVSLSGKPRYLDLGPAQTSVYGEQIPSIYNMEQLFSSQGQCISSKTTAFSDIAPCITLISLDPSTTLLLKRDYAALYPGGLSSSYLLSWDPKVSPVSSLFVRWKIWLRIVCVPHWKEQPTDRKGLTLVSVLGRFKRGNPYRHGARGSVWPWQDTRAASYYEYSST
jgi:hypothetical protein